MLNNTQLAKRWGVPASTFYRYKRDRPVFFELVVKGAEKNFTDDIKYPFLKPDELEMECNKRGFTLTELAKNSCVAKNSIKNWMVDPIRVTRFWDLLTGYHLEILARVQ